MPGLAKSIQHSATKIVFPASQVEKGGQAQRLRIHSKRWNLEKARLKGLAEGNGICTTQTRYSAKWCSQKGLSPAPLPPKKG